MWNFRHHLGDMKVGTGLQTTPLQWAGKPECQNLSHSRTSKLWMGVATLPCLEGSWPLALTLGLCFQCHLSCSAVRTARCLSRSSQAQRAQHHIPARAAATLCCAGTHRDCCSARNVSALATLPSPVPCIITGLGEVGAWRTNALMKIYFLFTAGLGIYLLRIPSYFVPADFANTCTFH